MEDSTLQEIRSLIEPILTEQNAELVEMTYRPHGGQMHIRLLVDKVGGITIQECARVNQRIAEALETANLIEGAYTVEVSSPGLDRPLTSHRDFERAVGEDVQLDVAAEDGQTKTVRGMLLAVQPAAVVIRAPSGNVTIPLTQVRVAKKALRW